MNHLIQIGPSERESCDSDRSYERESFDSDRTFGV